MWSTSRLVGKENAPPYNRGLLRECEILANLCLKPSSHTADMLTGATGGHCVVISGVVRAQLTPGQQVSAAPLMEPLCSWGTLAGDWRGLVPPPSSGRHTRPPGTSLPTQHTTDTGPGTSVIRHLVTVLGHCASTVVLEKVPSKGS